MFGRIFKITMRRRWALGAGRTGHQWTPIKNDREFWLSLIGLFKFTPVTSNLLHREKSILLNTISYLSDRFLTFASSDALVRNDSKSYLLSKFKPIRVHPCLSVVIRENPLLSFVSR